VPTEIVELPSGEQVYADDGEITRAAFERDALEYGFDASTVFDQLRKLGHMNDDWTLTSDGFAFFRRCKEDWNTYDRHNAQHH